MNQINLRRPVFLCGMMGSGKTTIGKRLAEQLDAPFIDLDTLIEETQGMTIPEIFAEKKEEGFRQIERISLINLPKEAAGVVALGGGSLQNQQIVDHLKLFGWLVYIDAPRDEILKRVKNSSGRPMLDNSNSNEVSDRLESLFSERIPFYKQAHFSIQTGKRSIDEIVTEIQKKLTIYEDRHHS